MTPTTADVEVAAPAFNQVSGPPARLMRAEELFWMPDDQLRHELVQGVLTTMPPTGFAHGTVTVNMSLPVAKHVQENNLGVACGADMGFVITKEPDTVRA